VNPQLRSRTAEAISYARDRLLLAGNALEHEDDATVAEELSDAVTRLREAAAELREERPRGRRGGA
jgi:hypothetical protein